MDRVAPKWDAKMKYSAKQLFLNESLDSCDPE